MSKRDYYDVLGVSRQSEKDDIKKAYRKLAVKYHPDRNPGDKSAEDSFKEVSEAYEVLSDPKKKQMYDQFGHAGLNQGAGGGGFGGFDFGGFGGSSSGGSGSVNDIFGDIFSDIFGGSQRSGGRGTRTRRMVRGADLQTKIDITFNEAAFGVEKIVAISKSVACDYCSGSGAKPGYSPTTCTQCGGRGEVNFQQGFFAVSRTCPACNGEGKTISSPCPKCNGSGHKHKKGQISVNIPPGVDTGQRLKLSGEGEAGERGGPSGDLYVVINVLDHDFFERDEYNVLCDVPVTFTQAALGCEIEVPTLKGKISLKIPEGTHSHKIFRLRGRGFPKLGAYGNGDQLVRVIIETPSRLSTEQKQILKNFEQSLNRSTQPKQHSFFEKVKNLFE